MQCAGYVMPEANNKNVFGKRRRKKWFKKRENFLHVFFVILNLMIL